MQLYTDRRKPHQSYEISVRYNDAVTSAQTAQKYRNVMRIQAHSGIDDSRKEALWTTIC
jgi:hypothetical protein